MTNCELYCMYFIIKEIICGTRHSSRCLFVFALYLSVVFAHFFEHKLPFSSPSHASLTVGVRESDSVCVCVCGFTFSAKDSREKSLRKMHEHLFCFLLTWACASTVYIQIIG